jgi:hypothetical protein
LLEPTPVDVPELVELRLELLGDIEGVDVHLGDGSGVVCAFPTV